MRIGARRVAPLTIQIFICVTQSLARNRVMALNGRYWHGEVLLPHRCALQRPLSFSSSAVVSTVRAFCRCKTR